MELAIDQLDIQYTFVLLIRIGDWTKCKDNERKSISRLVVSHHILNTTEEWMLLHF